MTKTLLLAAVVAVHATNATAQPPSERATFATDELIAYVESVGFTDVTYATLNWGDGWFEVGGVNAVWPQGGALSMQRIRFENLRPDDRWLRTDGLEIDGFAVTVPGFAMGLGEFRSDDLHIKDIDSFRPTASFSELRASGLVSSFAGWRVDLNELTINAQNWVSSLAVPGELRAHFVGGIGSEGAPYEHLSGDLDWGLSNYGGRARLILAAAHEGSGGAGFALEVKDLNDQVLWAWDDLNNPVILRDEEKIAEAKRKAEESLSEVKVESLTVKGARVPWVMDLLGSILSSGKLSPENSSVLEEIANGFETGGGFELTSFPP
ncbi:hypothetical protein [Roseibium sp. RKSG952]|uniref:hypothetical protein n=1 Tax=Roseibium sp. RKSG952 TaxID=2529384 RepID=UPI0012BCD613|nr:hypothetical protein [Roseibium sp. RKSG952]MTH94726.1 hypothetical protein [Roseibium sp. RKSG952]